MATIPKFPPWFKWAGAALMAVVLPCLPMPAAAVVTTCGQGFPCNPQTMSCSTAWSCCHIIGGAGPCVHQPQCDADPSECWEAFYAEPPGQFNWICVPKTGAQACTMPTVPLLAAIKLKGGWPSWTTHINETRKLLLRYLGDLKILQPNDALYKGRLRAYLHIANGLDVVIRAVTDPPNDDYQHVPSLNVTPTPPPLQTDASLTPVQAAALDAWALPMRQMTDALEQYNATLDNLGGAILDYQAGHQATAKPWVCSLARATDAALARASAAGGREVAARAGLSVGPVKAMAGYCPTVADQVKVMQDVILDGATSYDAALLGQQVLGACVPAATWPTDFIATSSVDAAWYASWTSLGNTAAVQTALGITCPPLRVLGDLDGDGTADLLFRSPVSGALTAWLMNGTSVTSTATATGQPAATALVGRGDFNGDSKGDLLWKSPSGVVTMQLMNGAAVLSTTTLGTLGAEWSVAGIGDFNGDGKADILWRNSTGLVYLWLMNGATVLSATTLGSVGLEYTVAGIGDVNGDGKSDVLWRHSSGLVYLWFMNGASITSQGSPGTVGPEWVIRGVGDLNGDGRADIVWRHASGTVYVWLMNGLAVIDDETLGPVGLEYTLRALGDFNGDGKADLLWQHSNGTLLTWLMNGVAIGSSGSPGSVPAGLVVQP